MKLLCISHTGTISGAERSLLDLLAGLRGEATTRLACPALGPLAEAAMKLGVAVDPLPSIDGSLKLHPRETPLAIAHIALASLSAARYARRMGAEVIHANSVRAGLVAVPAARLSGIPTAVHVRDRLPRSRVADLSLRIVARRDRIIIANSRYTAEGVAAVTDGGHVQVVYNPVDLARFDARTRARNDARAGFGLPVGCVVLAIVGQITPWKGQREAVQALVRARQLRRDADIRLLIVGEPKFVSSGTRYDNRQYVTDLERLIEAERVGEFVQFLGEREDIPHVMGTLDALLVPSWEEPFGRVVIEGMALGVPVLATSIGGPSEIIRDGIDGLLLPPHAPNVWAEAIGRLVDSPELRASLSTKGPRRAADFSLERHVASMRSLLELAARTPVRRRA